MTRLLELSEKDFIAAVMKALQQGILSRLENNKKIGSLSEKQKM